MQRFANPLAQIVRGEVTGGYQAGEGVPLMVAP